MQASMQAADSSMSLPDSPRQDAVVPTRLRPPLLPADTVDRPRLTAAILDGVAGPLTLVCAPAGFGKTVALTTALEAADWPVAWLSLEALGTSLPLFVRCFAAVIQQHYPAACRSTLSLLQLPRVPPPSAVAQVLGDDLDTLPDDCVVVLMTITRSPAPTSIP